RIEPCSGLSDLLSSARGAGRAGHQASLPAIAPFRAAAEAGVLMAYSADLPEMLRRAAEYVDRSLQGTKRADLPMGQATKVGIVITLKTAKGLGLTIPSSLLLRADH